MKSPLSYLGGKSKLAKHIVGMIPQDHGCYVEPFAGAAWVLFTKEPSKAEIINDLNGELVMFWRVVQNHLQPFLEYFKYAVVSRKLFELEKKKDVDTLTDIQRAVRFYYLQRLAFSGRPTHESFGISTTSPPRFSITNLEESLLETHWRLKNVTIEHLDAIKCIERYDRPHTLFYIDPPYFFSGKDYPVHFEGDDFNRLRAALGKVAGRFILSLNDCDQVRTLFADFKIKRVSLTYGSAPKESRAEQHHEVLISNF